jgi:hypothetical protein
MGLFVVGRLAARHGVKVRLQPATTGGLTALVWLPDAVVLLPEAGAAVGLGPAEPDAMASSARPAPTPEDVRALQPVASGLPAGPGLPPRHARPALRLRAPVQAQPPVQAQAPAVPRARASRQAFSWSEAASRPRPAEVSRPSVVHRPVPAGEDPGSQAAGDQAAGDQAAGDQAIGEATDDPGQRRLPIYEAVESDWFTIQGMQSGGAGPADADWVSPADSGWEAAKAVLAPASDGVTTAGLPVRVPHANLVPGAVGRAQPGTAGPGRPADAARPADPVRSADAARNRLAGFQRGASRGRAAAGGGQDETP